MTQPLFEDTARGSSLLAAAACPFLWWSLGAEAWGNQTRRPPEGRSKFSGWQVEASVERGPARS